MKRALISPQEMINGSGYRVAQVEEIENEFEVAPPFYWIDCDDDVMADYFYLDASDNQIKIIPNVVLPTQVTENDILNELLNQLK